MKKIYFVSSLLLFCISCATKVSYIGNTFSPTQHIDVFVDERAVKNTYDIMGKGYVGRSFFSKLEKIQLKAVAKARQKGADAVLIKDYYIPGTGADINTTTRIDSVGKGLVSLGHTTIQHTGSSGFNVLFLKYNKSN